MTPDANETEKPEIGNPNPKPEPEEKGKNKPAKDITDFPDDAPEIGDQSSLTKDEQESSYYYDDSTGYAKYDPADEG